MPKPLPSEMEEETTPDKQIYRLRKMPKPEIDLNVRFDFFDRLDTKSHALKISAESPLEGAWICCSIPIHFLPSKSASYEMTRTDSESEQKLGNKFSATLRFKPNCTSAEFSFRAVAGYAGILEIFVSAVNNTGRVTQREIIPIAPLSTYRRIESLEENRFEI